MRKSSWASAEEGPGSGIVTPGQGGPLCGAGGLPAPGAVGKPVGVVLRAMLVRGRTSWSPGEEAGSRVGAWPRHRQVTRGPGPRCLLSMAAQRRGPEGWSSCCVRPGAGGASEGTDSPTLALMGSLPDLQPIRRHQRPRPGGL